MTLTLFMKTNIITAAMLLLAASCGQNAPKQKTAELAEPQQEEVAVYVAGYVYGAMSGRKATLWIDGEPKILGEEGSSSAQSVFVTKDHTIYVAGHEESIPTLWKIEGDQTTKIVLDHASVDVFISVFATEEGDVYVAGSEFVMGEEGYYVAACWKVSGTKVTRIPLSPKNAMANSIFVASNGNVYISGFTGGNEEVDPDISERVATIWVNGKGQFLKDGKGGWANAVYVTDHGDVYAIGCVDDVAVLWKNNVLQTLSDDAEGCTATSIFVSDDGDLYVAGYEYRGNKTNAVLWKNGNRQNYPDNGFALSVCVTQGGDVYVAGRTYAPDQALLWKNGVVQALSNDGRNWSSAHGVFVQQLIKQSASKKSQTVEPKGTEGANIELTETEIEIEIEPIPIYPQKLSANEIPGEIPYQGDLVEAYRYTDKTGENIVITAETEAMYAEVNEYGDVLGSKSVYAHRFLKTGSDWEEVWRVYDMEFECFNAPIANIVRGALSFTDLNHDGVAEIWMIYIKSCRGDISPDNMFLRMYQDEEVYTMTGQTKVVYEPVFGGDYTMDHKFLSRDTPEAFVNHAKTLWEKHIKGK